MRRPWANTDLHAVMRLRLMAQNEIHHRLGILARQCEKTLTLGHQHRALAAEFLWDSGEGTNIVEVRACDGTLTCEAMVKRHMHNRRNSHLSH
jgi:hypothetical protein